jgi:hypothetical protein
MMRVSAIVCLVVTLLAGSSAAAQSQVVATAPLQAANERLEGLVRQYGLATDLTKPSLGRQISRLLRSVPETSQTATLRAQALVALSRQAASESRKDHAYRLAQQAASLAVTASGPSGNAVRAHASVALAQAQLMKEDYFTAVRTINAARRAYGPMVDESDPIWDELLLWATITKMSTPKPLQSTLANVEISDEDEAALQGLRNSACDNDPSSIVRIGSIGQAPVYPVVSLFSNLQGGVALRSRLSPDGRVIFVTATAFAPTEGFAAAAEVAARTWQYRIAPTTSPGCRSNFLTIMTFNIR